MKTLALLLIAVWCTPLAGAPAEDAPASRTVTLDVKDADVRDILKSMQKQCGIKNLVIDPDVKGSTPRLIFKDVPCQTAFRVVFRQFGLAGQVDATVTSVEPRQP